MKDIKLIQDNCRKYCEVKYPFMLEPAENLHDSAWGMLFEHVKGGMEESEWERLEAATARIKKSRPRARSSSGNLSAPLSSASSTPKKAAAPFILRLNVPSPASNSENGGTFNSGSSADSSDVELAEKERKKKLRRQRQRERRAREAAAKQDASQAPSTSSGSIKLSIKLPTKGKSEPTSLPSKHIPLSLSVPSSSSDGVFKKPAERTPGSSPVHSTPSPSSGGLKLKFKVPPSALPSNAPVKLEKPSSALPPSVYTTSTVVPLKKEVPDAASLSSQSLSPTKKTKKRRRESSDLDSTPAKKKKKKQHSAPNGLHTQNDSPRTSSEVSKSFYRRNIMVVIHTYIIALDTVLVTEQCCSQNCAETLFLKSFHEREQYVSPTISTVLPALSIFRW